MMMLKKPPPGMEGSLDYITGSEDFYGSIVFAQVAFVLLDRATGWVQRFPQASKSAEHTAEALRQFAGTEQIKLPGGRCWRDHFCRSCHGVAVRYFYALRSSDERRGGARGPLGKGWR